MGKLGPFIKIKPPGPKAKEYLERDSKYISPSYTRVYPLVAERGEGCWIYDVDGNKYLDLNAGVAVCALGHSHPEILKVIEEQSKKLIHYSGTDFYYPPEIDLAEKLAEISPGAKNRKVFFSNSGAEAIECAIKLVKYHTNRPYLISFYSSFHGRTMGALSLTASKEIQRKGFYSLIPGIYHVYYPYCYRCVFNLSYPDCNFYCVEIIEETLFRKVLPPEEVAAIFFEPIQGEGGYVVPPPNYFKKLKELADKYGILLVDDEVQTGMGRTGKFFGIEHWGIIPDILTVAKGIAGGLPLGACIAKSGIMSWKPGSHASTFGGNPVACKVSLKIIEILENGLLENVRKAGEYLLNLLKEIEKRYEIIGDVRGKGLMIGVEIVKDKKSKERDKERRDKIVYKCFEKGVLLLPAGENCIRFCPPLIISKEEIDIGIEIFEGVIKEI
jgi:4-aminobutyrate aminotransferase